MEDAAPPRARPLHQSLPCAGLGAHRDGRLRLPSLPGCSYPLHPERAEWNGQVAVPDGHPRGSQAWTTSEGPQEREMHASRCVCVCLSLCLSVSRSPKGRVRVQQPQHVAGFCVVCPEPSGRRCWDSPARTWVPPPLRNHPHSDFCQPLFPGHLPFPFSSPFAQF